MQGAYLIGHVETKDKKLLKSASSIRAAICKVCGVMGFRIVGEKCYTFDAPPGVTYCFILSQSHFIIHTWPEESKIFFDLFTCGEEVNAERLIETISKEFKGKVGKIRRIGYK
ncbi:S-adenosylmethionine decarboxylase [Candidatus Woesearchaeota archaeon]|nr:S-adenosylmethionine decarboxylase [Candidatus Woesearchaeota archaeon]